MNGAEFRALVADEPLLADGGIGSSLIERGIVGPDDCVEILNLDRPDVVRAVHRAFADAGSKLVETNTFGANRFALGKLDLEGRVDEINRRGVELAREAGVLVAGSVGPLRVRLAPYGRVKRSQARKAYAEQIGVLAAAGADLILIETQSDLIEMEEALQAARSVCDLAVIVTATFTRDDRTLLGSTPENVASRLVELGADAVGVNCSEGPAQVLRIITLMRDLVGSTPLVAMPNAGGPARVGERIVYPATPEYLGDYARAFVASGASIVGGCCGTGPEHIRSMAEALAGPRQLLLEILPAAPAEGGADTASSTTALGAKLAAGQFVVTVEMDPPRSTSTAKMLAGAETLFDAGADVINVADSPMARMRMSPWAPARLIHEHVGIETILHFPIRGRNLLRIQGDLLAGHALGIRNLFVCLGDPTRIGDYPDATDNVDVVPTGLISLITESLNRGKDQVGASIGEPTSFVVGCAVNLGAADLERECRLLDKKIRSGADYALAMPTFSADVLRVFRKSFEERHGPLRLPVLVGVLPLVTSRHAEFLHNELPGVSIPDDIRARMRDAGKRATRAGVEIATELSRELRAEAAGLYVMPPFGRYDLAAEIVEAVRKLD
ncbi:MAG TPA: bifunctional homocysteine S-methyltransferase/methylenetetrahydrofolate reductase [Actinomycetota bacterium]|jgi:homocysteine S-methyltransferase|nr:bifunctional homocysteine S-methyltransferase/methylenetetrahydrofolate reductase [Actinomycetota bacterium]